MRRTHLLTAAFVLTCFLFVGHAHAKCASQGLYRSPKSGAKDVPLNVKPFFSLYGTTRALLPYLKGATLSSSGHHVPLKVVTHNAGTKAMRMAYLSLVPQSSLKANRTYRLRLSPKLVLPPVTPRMSWRVKSMIKGLQPGGDMRKRLEGYTLHTGKSADTKPPARPAKIKTPGYRFRMMGCGPSRQISLEVKGNRDDATPSKKLRYIVEATVVSKFKTHRISLLTGIPWRSNHTYIGHGMCSGNMAQLPKGMYKIRVRAVDFAGNVSKPSTAVRVRVN